MSGRRGVYPGSFDPPTHAHLAVADAARRRHHLDRVDLAVSRVALVKGPAAVPSLEQRVAVLEAVAARVGWLGVVVSDRQLIVELAEGYDVVVMGADKWHQVGDPAFYGGDPAARDDAVARLPTVAVAPRPPWSVPAALLLDVADEHHHVSSTRARGGDRSLMVPEAAEADRRHGWWTGRVGD